MTNQGASSSSSSTHSHAYDVFLSYNSADTSAFSCHLYDALCRTGINTLLHEEPVRGDEMSATFLQIYEQSKISLIVFSETFASSTWLDQLAEIIHRKKSKKQLVQPIFYKVDPTNQRDQSIWKAGLSKVASLSRWCFLEGYDSHFIHMVVKDISSTLPNGTSLDVAMHTVGMGSRVRDICDLLKIGDNSVHMVGIWGMGGIGKTTLAKSVYNSIARRFEGTCFLANVREMSMLHEGLVRLQQTLLTDIIEDKSLRVTNIYQGMQLIEEKLSQKRVLLVLDDVNAYNILQTLAQRSTWFGPGSRIIITTRDRHVLNAHQVETIYEVNKLNHDEALELFSWHAFRGQPFGDYAEPAMNVIEYAYGHPLLLIVLGSHLRGRSIDEWKETAHSKTAHYNQVGDVLRRSYDALDETAKIAFLDIACFFKGKKMKKVQQILEDSGLDFSYIIQELVEKALITIQNQPLVGEVISMHDLIAEMGRDIVRQESFDEPGKRSRLWHHEDVDHVLTSNTGTDKIRGIMVKFPKPDEISMFLCPESFSNMKNLKFFVSGDVCLSGDFFSLGSLPKSSLYPPPGDRRWNERYDANACRSKQGIHKSNSSMAASEHRRSSDEYELREVALLLPQQVPPATLTNQTPLRVREAGPSNSVTEETDSLLFIHKCKATAVEASIDPPSPPTASHCSDEPDIDVEDLDLGRAMSLAEMSFSNDTTI